MDNPEIQEINNNLGAKIKIKDHDAFKMFVQINTSWMTNYVKYRLRSKFDAEEVVQDVFMKIWNKSNLWNPLKGNYSSWINSVLRHTMIDKMRFNKKIFQKEKFTDDDIDYLNCDPSEKYYESLNTTEREVVSKDSMFFLEKSILQLNTKYRITAILYYLEGYSSTQIAKILNMKVGTAKIYVFRSTRMLRNMLKEIYYNGEYDEDYDLHFK